MIDNIIPFDRHQPRAARIEIEGGIQDGPATWTGAGGTRLDWSNAGSMVYWAALIFDRGGAEILDCGPSHDAVAENARSANQDYGVEIVDRVIAP